MHYERFEDWFDEVELFSTRSDRFFESLDQFQSKQGFNENLVIWLRAAFESARLPKDQ